jgi:hypothetical protein
MPSSKNRRKAQRKATRPHPTPVAKAQAPTPPAIEAGAAEEDAAPVAAQPPAQVASTRSDAKRQANTAASGTVEPERPDSPPTQPEPEPQMATDLLEQRERSVKLLEGRLAERFEKQDERDREAGERQDRRDRELDARELAIDELQRSQLADGEARAEELRADRKRLEQDLRTRTEKAEQRLQQWEADLEARESKARELALNGQKQLNDAQVAQNTLQAERELVEDRKDLLKQAAEESASARIDDLKRSNESLSERLGRALDASRSLEAELGAHRDATRAQDGRSFADVDAERQHWRQRCEELEQRPAVDQGPLVDQLRSQARASDEMLALAQRENEELEGKLQSTRVEASARERAQRLAETMQAQLDGYKEALKQAKEDLGLLSGKHAARTEFARMTAMDADSRLARSPGKDLYGPTDLAQLVGDVRNQIAARPLRPGERLYYTTRDVRLFLAGLAGWRLQLLEGLSGTGKTSLPLAFAQAVGAGAAVVEVQAGWRDRQDLIGHYNTFEGRYEETRFVQALYEAQCPAYADCLYLVVLDEINLSHPEQYFSDLNSLLERSHEEHHITLTNAAKGELPQLLSNGNLRIPENAWFVGTANQDDTTVGFAEKTYDRAHVQELPEQPVPFDPEPPAARRPLSYTALTKLFSDAVERYDDDAALGIAYLREYPGERLRERFDVRWGARFDQRVGRFIAVLRACGGTLDEAVDHVLATKILRKMKDRHDVLRGDIDDLYELIETSSQELHDTAALPLSLDVLARVRQRLDNEGG